jgi:RNA polymerase sigma factor (TIGR02999 family)
MTSRGRADITGLLKKLNGGDPDAVAEIVSVVYPELRRIARAYMRSERGEHTLQPTALINEAWIRLVDQTRVDWRDRTHFFGVAASMMRRVLVDHARQRLADKRGGGQRKLSIDWVELQAGGDKLNEVLSVHEALERLDGIDARLAKIVELRYFAGMDVDETAVALGISPRTVDREWSMARAWLSTQLSPSESS